MNPTALSIAQRLSLRPPLRDALDQIAAVAAVVPLRKPAPGAADVADLPALLAAVQAVAPTCQDFERGFPSVGLSIATGVGKTRLMGATIAYLHQQHGVRNFFVLAPNLTIYQKLIEDFGNPAAPKYVFQGLPEFAIRRPVVVTGDNYTRREVSCERSPRLCPAFTRWSCT